MTTKHTPGPWESRPLYSTNDNLSGVFYLRKSATARTSHRLDDKGAFAHADARLIAAAPDLLAALEPFITIWAAGGSDYKERMDKYWGYDRLNKARAAIAKAKGEA